MSSSKRIWATTETADSLLIFDVTDMPAPILEKNIFLRGLDKPYAVGPDRILQKFLRWAKYQARIFLTVEELNRKVVFVCREEDVAHVRPYVDAAGLRNPATGGLVTEINVGLLHLNLLLRIEETGEDVKEIGRFTHNAAARLWSGISEKMPRLLQEWENRRVLKSAFGNQPDRQGKFNLGDLVTIGVTNLLIQSGIHYRHFSTAAPLEVFQTEDEADDGGEV